jgi:hypothetical protein
MDINAGPEWNILHQGRDMRHKPAMVPSKKIVPETKEFSKLPSPPSALNQPAASAAAPHRPHAARQRCRKGWPNRRQHRATAARTRFAEQPCRLRLAAAFAVGTPPRCAADRLRAASPRMAAAAATKEGGGGFRRRTSHRGGEHACGSDRRRIHGHE